MASEYMECVKTGAITQINDLSGQGNRWAKGDLYRFGSGYVLKAVFWCADEPVDWMTNHHALFEGYHNWWSGTHFGGTDDHAVIFLDEPLWYDYDGRVLPK